MNLHRRLHNSSRSPGSAAAVAGCVMRRNLGIIDLGRCPADVGGVLLGCMCSSTCAVRMLRLFRDLKSA